MQSGAWRMALRSASWNERVSLPTSRWLKIDFFGVKTNSTGSSMVRMWPACTELRWSSIEARVVDLPEPVAPTTRIRPRFSITSCVRIGGRFRSAARGISAVMKRITQEIEPFCQNMLTRKLPRPGIGLEKLSSRSFSKVAIWLGVSIS